jgi:ABC-type antimicrobial peptide transport system permease subunit
MTSGRLLARNLVYHWRGNVAVGLGVVVGTAVLTGALLVGDSLRGSLRDLSQRQLEWVDYALIPGRFFEEDLAFAIPGKRVVPTILLQGSAAGVPSEDSQSVRRVGQVSVFGVATKDWNWHFNPQRAVPSMVVPDHEFIAADMAGDQVALNEPLAKELGVSVGDRVVLQLPKPSPIPRETALGRRKTDDVFASLELTVASILADGAPGSRFSLNPTPAAPRNAFVPIPLLQDRLEVKGRINAILFGGGIHDTVFGDKARASTQEWLSRVLLLEDWGLTVRTPQTRVDELFRKLGRKSSGVLSRTQWQGRIAEAVAKAADADGDGKLSRSELLGFYEQSRGYISLESRQMILEPAVAKAAFRAAKDSNLNAAPTLVYLANWIESGRAKVPYSIVAALDPALPPPLGPFLPAGVTTLQDDEIVLADLPESPLKAMPGDQVKLTYFEPVEGGQLREPTATLRLLGMIPIQGVAEDSDLTPEFPGITDKLDIRDWNPPFDYDNKRVTRRDENYWKLYRTTPKAYITLKKGQELWGSRFGNLTSIRLAPEKPVPGAKLQELSDSFSSRLRDQLNPEEGGFVLQDLRDHSLQAGSSGTDFAMLFLGFSFFLIVAALLLVGLLFRLNMDRRAAQIGLLFATGYRRRRVGLLLLGEGAIVSALGAAFGCLAAFIYATVLLDLLRSRWPGGLDRSFLTLHASFQSPAIGFFASFLVSVATIAVAVWLFARVPPRVLLSGDTSHERDPAKAVKPPRTSLYIAGGFLVLAAILVVVGWFVHDHEARAGTFFSSGACLLTAALAALWAWMKRTRHGTVSGHGLPALTRLGARNGARNPLRSILTAGLLAAAAFLIVAVESFRRHTDADYLRKDSSSGGFSLLAESDVPLFNDLNSDKGREEVVVQLQRRLKEQGRETRPELAKAREELAAVEFFPFRTHGGDDASCLNLYQPRRPKLLGASSRLIARGGFQFAASEAKSDDERQNPWRLLDREDDAIPVIGEANTVTWMLKTKLGGELEVQNERGETVKLRIVGLLHDSVFQSGLIMSEKNLLKLYPSQEGYNLFLIDTRDQRPAEVRKLLENSLADRGFEVTPTVERLEKYLAVENTYLSTFQLLGGLGLLLGALGLAVVLLRGVWERRGELALLRALGFRHRDLGRLVLAENGFLLLLGLGAGTVAALVSVAPYLISGAGQLPLLRLLGLFSGVLLVGLIAGALAMRAALQAPLIPALRRE